MNRDQKAVVITMSIIFSLAIFMYIMSPLFINAYFNFEKAYTVKEANEKYEYGKVIVVSGEIISIGTDDFILANHLTTETGINPDHVLIVKRSDKMNCFPEKEMPARIAGAWNQIGTETVFYGVWVIDGCKA